MVNYSNPVSPNVSGVSPLMNSSGNIPIPAKLLRWILSNEITITALTP